MTPRKFNALLSVHFDIKRMENGEESKRDTGKPNTFIDQIPGW